MNVEIEFENYNIKSPKMPDPFNVNLINAVGSGGGGGGNEVELTWAEYEALSEAEKMNGTNYFITDINTTKSLTSKVLCEISSISKTTYTLNDDISNYDYVVIDLLTKSDNPIIRGSMIIKNNYVNGGILTGFTKSNWYGSVEFRLSGTSFIIDDFSQSSDVISSYSTIHITGYIYQRVVVPNQMINYSTIETKIGTWIDGKPLYQKVVTFDSSDLQADTTGKKLVLAIQDIDSIKTYQVFVTNGTIPLPYSEPNVYFGYFLAYDSTNAVDFRFRYSTSIASDLSIYFAGSIAILQYTKTTD